MAALLSVLLAAGPATAQTHLDNQLQGHPSAYLAMHGADPVNWQTWDQAALALAREQNKPLFLSSGYFACHWCHVMQRESYADGAVAALLNRYFIPVKVDRELEPALDGYLIDFVQRSRGSAGWPLNVFVTPDGYPLLGLTYATREVFHRLLIRLSSAWQNQADELAAMARSAAQEMAQAETPVPPVLPAEAALLGEKLTVQAFAVADEMQGGFGQQTRFPMAPRLAALLERHARAPQPRLARFLTLTLRQMAGQGLRDQLMGGFFRYTVDPGWQVPHFEKMLYDQALNATLFLDAARILQQPEFREVARETLDFVLNRMAAADGGYIASFSAVDDKGEEGGAYLWREAQLQTLLDPLERRLAGLVWNLQGTPNNEGGYLPVQAAAVADAAQQLNMDAAEAGAVLARARMKLALARAARPLPADTKTVAAWNGLLLTALVRATETLGEEYRQPAQALRDFLVRRLWDGGSLVRSLNRGRRLGTAALEDYVFVARALLDWAALADSKADRELAQVLVREAWRRFYERGWKARNLLPAMPAVAALEDASLPSPSAMLIDLTLDSTDATLRDRADEALRRAYAEVAQAPFNHAGHVRRMTDHGVRATAARP